MEDADWKALWDEMRFLQQYTDHIARMAVVGADKWEEIVAVVIAGTAVLQAETRYFTNAEIGAAWEWVRTSKNADRVPVRRMYESTGLFKNDVPEYTDLYQAPRLGPSIGQDAVAEGVRIGACHLRFSSPGNERVKPRRD